MPKDIRSYFGGAAGKSSAENAEASKRKSDIAVVLTSEEEETPQKRRKVGNGQKKKAQGVNRATPKPAAKAATPKKGATKKKAAATKRPRESESENDSDDDFSMEEEESAGDDDSIVDLDSEEDTKPAPKATRARKFTAGPAKAMPVSKKSETPPKSKAKSVTPSKPEAKTSPKPKQASPHPETKPKPASKAVPKAVPKTDTAPAKASAKAAKVEVPPDVVAAVAAVDAAALKLPTFEVDLMDPSAFGQGQTGAESAPPNAGSKDISSGHPECLRGKAFVITGVLDSLWRNEAEDLIKRHNGRVTSAVSGKTSFLLRGDQPGKSKTAQAVAKGTKIIDEDGLIALIKAAPDPSAAKSKAAAPAAADTDSAARKAQLQEELNKVPAARPRMPAQSIAALEPNQGGQSSSGAAGAGGQLWVEKHRPKTQAELVGNTSAVATLRQWLKDWDAVNLRGQDVGAAPGRGKPKDMSKKAVLLSGPPGIGKTSCAMIITGELGYTAVEVNASDTRNKADSKITLGIGGKLSNSIKELATNSAIGLDARGKPKKICLVMDEVDGMSGSDRGGISELITTIKRSKVPIICICNDKYNQKLRSLRNSTLELDFRKPTAQQIVNRMMSICRQEGLQVNESTLQALAEGTNGDIRLVLGQLQMVRLRAKALSYDEAKGRMGTTKDADMSPFEAARRLLSAETARMSLIDRAELVFQDIDLVPLLIQENYLNHRPAMLGASGDPVKHLRVIARAADAISQGDIVNRSVRQFQNWSLMPFAATLSSVLPATYMRGTRETFFPGEMNFPRFTAWLGHNSSQTKQKRLLGELHARVVISGACVTDRSGLRMQYLPALRTALVKPLIDQEKEGIPIVVQMLEDYCLTKDDFEYIQSVTHFKGTYPWNVDLYKSVPTTVKSAFTRQLNQAVAHQKPRSNIQVEEFKLRRSKKAAAAADSEMDGLGGDPELEAAAAAERKAKEEAAGSQNQDEDEEEEPSVKDIKEMERKQRILAKRGIIFDPKADVKAKKSGSKASGASRASGAASGRGSAGRASSRGRGRGAKAK